MRTEEVAAAFSGERLRLARFRSRLTVRELASRVEVSHAAISQYETGRSRPTGGVIARLAMATGVSAAFFVPFGRRSISPGGLDGAHFRSLRATTKQSRAAAWAWSESVLDLAYALERHVRLPEQRVPSLGVDRDVDVSELEDVARQVRAEWRLPDGPVGNLVRHLEARGVIVARLGVADRGVDDRGIDAFSHSLGPRHVVVLGTEKSDTARSRFNAAHELGHLVCHPDADPGSRQEQQAHAFAAEFLMPRAHMLHRLPRRFDLGAYGRLKQEWGVSIAALLYRARTLGVISESAHRRAVMLMNREYGRRDEPYPLLLPERPALLATACEVAVRSGISMTDIADEAGLPLSDVLSIVGQPEPRPQIQIE